MQNNLPDVASLDKNKEKDKVEEQKQEQTKTAKGKLKIKPIMMKKYETNEKIDPGINPFAG